MGQKRRRLALSCVACRRRKVRCGRELPRCVRCVKGGVGDSCKYVSYDDKLGNLLTPTDDSPDVRRELSEAEESWTEEADAYHRSSKIGKAASANVRLSKPTGAAKHSVAPERSLEQLQERVFELETYVRSAGSRPVSSEMFLGMGHPHGPGSRPKDHPQEFERSLLRGKSFKTQYFGPTNAASLLLQFEELSAFVKEILKRMPNLGKSKEVFKHVRVMQETAAGHRNPNELTLEAFIAMVPARSTADPLVNLFFDIFETTYRILHAPTFMQSYEDYWSRPEGTDLEFVVQLLLVMATVYCVQPNSGLGFVGRSSVGRELCHQWIEATETWLDQQSHKHTTLEYYQTWILLLIAKRMTCYKVKRDYTVSQNLLSMAMAAGFHREPTSLSLKISPFDQEMRRRLWYTILELNIESCCDRGIRSSVGPDDWDCLPPLNVHDEDFKETTQTMPSARPLSDFTRTACLCKAAQHLPLRLEMLTRMNSISRTLELSTVMAFDAQIRAELDSLPVWPDKPHTQAAAAVSVFVLQDYLLLLHQPFATQQMAQAQYFYSRCTRREAALNTLQLYSDLPTTHSLAFSDSREGGYRSALALCHDLAVAGSRHDLMQNKQLALDLISKFVDLCGLRVKALGQGFHSFWLNSSALGLARMKLAPAPANHEEFVLEAVNRMVKLHNELMQMQTTGRDGKNYSPVAEVAPQPSLPDAIDLEQQQQPLHPGLDTGDLPAFDFMNTAMFDFDFDDTHWWADAGMTSFP